LKPTFQVYETNPFELMNRHRNKQAATSLPYHKEGQNPKPPVFEIKHETTGDLN